MKAKAYKIPSTEVFPVFIEDVICGTQNGVLHFNPNPGSAGNDIDEDDIIDGGSF
jgi:hypothetical protein